MTTDINAPQPNINSVADRDADYHNHPPLRHQSAMSDDPLSRTSNLETQNERDQYIEHASATNPASHASAYQEQYGDALPASQSTTNNKNHHHDHHHRESQKSGAPFHVPDPTKTSTEPNPSDTHNEATGKARVYAHTNPAKAKGYEQHQPSKMKMWSHRVKGKVKNALGKGEEDEDSDGAAHSSHHRRHHMKHNYVKGSAAAY